MTAPAASAFSTSATVDSRSKASGFSTKTGFPASMHSETSGACMLVDAATITASAAAMASSAVAATRPSTAPAAFAAFSAMTS